MRSRLAQLAARLMAEDGIDDFAHAKRKAARQAGITETRALPSNAEIEQALGAYRDLYQPEIHRARLDVLRRKAAGAMRFFAEFNPFLTGPVLSGRAGKYAHISLQLFADSLKSVELFLMNRRIPYQTAESRLFVGDEERAAPGFILEYEEAELRLAVLSIDDQRQVLRSTATGEPLRRAKLETLEAMIERPQV